MRSLCCLRNTCSLLATLFFSSFLLLALPAAAFATPVLSTCHSSPPELVQLEHQARLNLQASSSQRAEADFGFGTGRQHTLGSFEKVANAFKQ